MLRKLDSRWALIQENEKDLIFVDENEIIYPKRINVDKEGLVDFFDFSGFQTDARQRQIGNFFDDIKPFCSYSNAAFYRIIGPILWSICSGWFKISYRGHLCRCTNLSTSSLCIFSADLLMIMQLQVIFMMKQMVLV